MHGPPYRLVSRRKFNSLKHALAASVLMLALAGQANAADLIVFNSGAMVEPLKVFCEDFTINI